jgi:pyridoxamine 5'-phosphate oxidase
MHDPIAKFAEWFEIAKATPGIKDATAMTLATASADGAPSARIVLLKSFDASGFVFYGNMESRKFSELKANPRAALDFYWAPLDRQVRIEGGVAPVTDAEADAYFASRERGKQIGAWASLQSQPMKDRAEFEARITEITRRYEGQSVPRPPHWSGWRLAPVHIEFWSQGEFRLHERELFSRAAVDAPWQLSLLYP